MISGRSPGRRVLIPSSLTPANLHGRDFAGAVCVLEGTTMGTFWKVCCLPGAGTSGADIRTLLEENFNLVISQMSHWDERSLLCEFNRAAAGTRHTLPPEFFRVLEHALQVAEESGGLCDPTLGEVVDLYGFGPASPGLDSGGPAAAALAEAARLRGWGRLRLDSQNQSAWQPGGLRLDLSAIAKGFAVDLAAENLQRRGIQSYLVEIGGEVRGDGCKPGGEPWWCAVEAFPGPDAGSLPETLAALCGLSVATSGDSLRQRRVEGNMVSHLIDPLSCRPAGRALAAVSVFHPSCMTADAWSTALFIAGPEKGPAMAESRHLAALFTCRTPDGFSQIETSALQAMMV